MVVVSDRVESDSETEFGGSKVVKGWGGSKTGQRKKWEGHECWDKASISMEECW